MEENAITIAALVVFFAGLFQIAKWIIAFGTWVSDKMYIICYGEKITPFYLFKLEDWHYTPWKVRERYKK